MISLALMSQNIREQQVLTMAFEQQGFKVVLSEPTYQNYVFIMQYKPDIIIIELPHLCNDQLNFIKRIHEYKRTHLIPIIGYGNKIEPSVLLGMQNRGMTAYVERPLKFNELLNLIDRQLKPFNKIIEKKPEISEKEKDVSLILAADAPPSQKVAAMCRHISQLCAFPFTIAKVLQITNDQRSGAAHLAHAITSDPAISTHLLKVSNSVFFASANHRIGSIKEAIVRIGFEETKKIVMGMSVINLFSQSDKNPGFDRTDFWYHCLTTALIAERSAKSFGDISAEEAFLAGLLHDLGMLLLDEFYPPVFSEVLRCTAQQAGRFFEQEQQHLKVTHLDLIAELFPKWKIPQQIADAITGHYRIASCSQPPDTAPAKLAACVAIGNTVAKLIHSGRECDEYVTPISNVLFESAKLNSGITTGFVDAITSQISAFRSFLGLEMREYPCSCPAGIDPKKIRIAVCNHDRSIFVPPVMDLLSHGIHCETLPATTNLSSEHDGRYHAVISWTTVPVDPAVVQPLTRLLQAPLDSTDSGEKGTKKVPVIHFCPDGGEPDRFAGCIVMSTCFDLRLLESRLEDLLTVHMVEQSSKTAVGAA